MPKHFGTNVGIIGHDVKDYLVTDVVFGREIVVAECFCEMCRMTTIGFGGVVHASKGYESLAQSVDLTLICRYVFEYVDHLAEIEIA